MILLSEAKCFIIMAEIVRILPGKIIMLYSCFLGSNIIFKILCIIIRVVTSKLISISYTNTRNDFIPDHCACISSVYYGGKTFKYLLMLIF